MLYTCLARFDVTENLEKFLFFGWTKPRELLPNFQRLQAHQATSKRLPAQSLQPEVKPRKYYSTTCRHFFIFIFLLFGQIFLFSRWFMISISPFSGPMVWKVTIHSHESQAQLTSVCSRSWISLLGVWRPALSCHVQSPNIPASILRSSCSWKPSPRRAWLLW